MSDCNLLHYHIRNSWKTECEFGNKRSTYQKRFVKTKNCTSFKLTYLKVICIYSKMAFPKFLRVAVSAKFDLVQVNEETWEKKLIFDRIGEKLTAIFSQKLGFSYELVTPKDGELGRPLGNGSWSGMVGMVQHGEADLVISILSVSEKRMEVVDFSYPFYRVRITFATRMPEYIPQLTSFVKPFTLHVWVSLLASLLIMTFFFYVLFGRQHSFQKCFLALYSAILHQSIRYCPRNLPEHVLFVFWRIGVLFVSYSYTAVLLSFLAFPTLQGIRTIPELATSVAVGAHYCVTFPGSFIVSSLSSASDHKSKIIGDDLLKNKGSKDVEAVLRSSKSDKTPAFLMDEDYFLPLKNEFFISEEEFFPSLRAIAMRKDFCCKKQLDRVVSYIWASGIYHKLVENDGYVKSLKQLNRTVDVNENNELQLSFEDLEGVFIMLLSGHILALIVFFLELLIGMYQKLTSPTHKIKKFTIKQH